MIWNKKFCVFQKKVVLLQRYKKRKAARSCDLLLPAR